MNLVSALAELQKARGFVTEGRKCLVEQRDIVARLERQGYDTLDAILFLEYLEEMQDKYEAHRDRLEAQIMGLVVPADD